MHLVLIIGAFLFLAALAPLMVTVATLASFAVVGLVGARTAQAVTGAPASMGAVLRSVGLAFVFSGLVLFGMMSMLGSVNLVLLVIAVLLAFIGGFSYGMDLDFGPACVVALATSAVSVGMYFLVKKVI